MSDPTYSYYPVYLWFSANLLLPLQKFSFQDIENARIKIAMDRTISDPEDLDHKDKMPKNTRAASAMGKASSSRHSIKIGVMMTLMGNA
jgi:hypothetical protein